MTTLNEVQATPQVIWFIDWMDGSGWLEASEGQVRCLWAVLRACPILVEGVRVARIER